MNFYLKKDDFEKWYENIEKRIINKRSKLKKVEMRPFRFAG